MGWLVGWLVGWLDDVFIYFLHFVAHHCMHSLSASVLIASWGGLHRDAMQTLRVIVTRGSQGRNQMLQMKFSSAITRFSDALTKLNALTAEVVDASEAPVSAVNFLATKATVYALKVPGGVSCDT